MDKKTIGVGALSAIIASLIILGGISLFDDNVYYCEDRDMVMKCDSLSVYYGLDNGKCNNKETGNKLCRSGWLKVIDDSSIPDEMDYAVKGKQYLCSYDGCEVKE